MKVTLKSIVNISSTPSCATISLGDPHVLSARRRKSKSSMSLPSSLVIDSAHGLARGRRTHSAQRIANFREPTTVANGRALAGDFFFFFWRNLGRETKSRGRRSSAVRIEFTVGAARCVTQDSTWTPGALVGPVDRYCHYPFPRKRNALTGRRFVCHPQRFRKVP